MLQVQLVSHALLKIAVRDTCLLNINQAIENNSELLPSFMLQITYKSTK